MTLGCLFLLIDYLEKIIHEGWLEVPMIFLPSSDDKLEIFWIMNYRGSWINKISKFCNFVI